MIPKGGNIVSDYESVWSQHQIRNRDDRSQKGVAIKKKSDVEAKIKEIEWLENVLISLQNILQQYNKNINLISGEIFRRGLKYFLIDFASVNYLKLFLNLNWNLESKKQSEIIYELKRINLLTGIKWSIIKNMQFNHCKMWTKRM